MNGEVEVNGKTGTHRFIGRRSAVTSLLTAVMLVVSTAPANAQQGIGSACPEGGELRAEIGISSFECSNCTMWTTRDDGGERSWSFSAEPTVRRVKSGSPAAGKIQGGDRLVAIDGYLITTSEGGRRLANLTPGEAVSLVVRRDGRERTVKVVPRAECVDPGVAPAAPAIASASGVAAAPAVPAVPVPGRGTAPAIAAAPSAGVAVGAVPRPTFDLLPSGWFGFGIQCTECRWSVDEEDGTSTWEFSSPPEVSAVHAGSPAAAAGLRSGDVLLEIDGQTLVSEEGGRRFGSVKPGQSVRWTYLRDGETRTATAVAGERPGMPVAPPAPPSSGAAVYVGPTSLGYSASDLAVLRYSGLVGPTSVEVRGAGSVVVNIVEPGRKIEIVTSDSRTLIRLDEPDKR